MGSSSSVQADPKGQQSPQNYAKSKEHRNAVRKLGSEPTPNITKFNGLKGGKSRNKRTRRNKRTHKK